MSSKEQARRLKQLIKANQTLADVESLQDLLERLLEIAQEVTMSEASSMLLYNEVEGCLEFVLARNDVLGGDTVALLKGSGTLNLGEGIGGWVGEHRQGLIVNDAQNDPRLARKVDSKTGFVTRCLMCVPVVHANRLLGVLQVLNSREKDRFDDDDLELMEAFANLAAVAMVRSELLESRLEQQKLTTQLEAASRIQQHFWPEIPDLSHDSHVWAVSKPAIFVGGDLYDCIMRLDGTCLLYVADVSGKGLPAALIMAAMWTRIRDEAAQSGDPGEILSGINEAMLELMPADVFATIVMGNYNPLTGELTLALGGHLPPVWVGRDSMKDVPELIGIPLGILGHQQYDTQTIWLEPGDSIIFMTDGITEARSESGELLGEDAVSDLLVKGGPRPLCKGLLEFADEWAGGAPASDDLTLLEIWRES